MSLWCDFLCSYDSVCLSSPCDCRNTDYLFFCFCNGRCIDILNRITLYVQAYTLVYPLQHKMLGVRAKWTHLGIEMRKGKGKFYPEQDIRRSNTTTAVPEQDIRRSNTTTGVFWYPGTQVYLYLYALLVRKLRKETC